jgi:hypothetical protein
MSPPKRADFSDLVFSLLTTHNEYLDLRTIEQSLLYQRCPLDNGHLKRFDATGAECNSSPLSVLSH